VTSKYTYASIEVDDILQNSSNSFFHCIWNLALTLSKTHTKHTAWYSDDSRTRICANDALFKPLAQKIIFRASHQTQIQKVWRICRLLMRHTKFLWEIFSWAFVVLVAILPLNENETQISKSPTQPTIL